MRDYVKLIGHLISKATSEQDLGHTEAAASYRAKAENLMREYRISEEEAIAKDQFSILPQSYEFTLMENDAYWNPLADRYASIFREIARHAGVRNVINYRWSEDGDYAKTRMVATVVGYEGDVNLVKFLWISARLVFVTRIDASVNPELSDQENCYYLRNSGMKRNEIATALWKSEKTDGVAHGRVQRLYLAECAARGEEPRVSGRGINVKLYREAYADGFVAEFGWKLRQARDAADAQGGALELKGRKERVDEAFYTLFPRQRPDAPMTKEEAAEYWAKQDEEEANCEACKTTKSQTGKCKSHRPYEVTQADRRASWKRHHSPEARAGQRAGTDAARAVNVQRTAGERFARTEAAEQRTALEG